MKEEKNTVEKRKVGRPKKEETEKKVATKKTTKTAVKKETTKKVEKAPKQTEAKKMEKKEPIKQEAIVENKVEEKVVVPVVENAPVEKTILPKEEVEKKEPPKKEKKETCFYLPEIIILTLVTCAVSLIVGMAFSTIYLSRKDKTECNTYSKEIQEIIKNYNYIKEGYEEVTDSQLLDGAIKGMLQATGDPYASMIERNSTLEYQLNGSFRGIGIQMYNNDEGNIEVMTVFDNSPAKIAGMQEGDIIQSIDGENCLRTSSTFLADYIRGKENSNYTIVVLRNGEEIALTMGRDYVELPSVYHEMKEKNGKKIGYIEISLFSATTPRQFEKALNELESAGMESLIIDVRENVGGRLDSVTEILSYFLSSEHVIYQEEEDGVRTVAHSEGTKDVTYPIVLLTNENSASSSEILVAALKEELNAVSIGTTTYGKGTVQRVKSLSNGNQYKTTVGKWLTPKGDWINGVGIAPTIAVELSEDYYSNPSDETDNQLQTALEYLGK